MARLRHRRSVPNTKAPRLRRARTHPNSKPSSEALTGFSLLELKEDGHPCGWPFFYFGRSEGDSKGWASPPNPLQITHLPQRCGGAPEAPLSAPDLAASGGLRPPSPRDGSPPAQALRAQQPSVEAAGFARPAVRAYAFHNCMYILHTEELVLDRGHCPCGFHGLWALTPRFRATCYLLWNLVPIQLLILLYEAADRPTNPTENKRTTV